MLLRTLLINLIGFIYCHWVVSKIRYRNYIMQQRIKWVMAYKRYL